MFSRVIILTCNPNIRKVYTSIPIRAQTAASAKKDDYYKNLSETQNADDSIPVGWNEALPLARMPGPKPLPVIGNVWRFLPGGEFYNKDILEVHKSMRKQYGPIMSFTGMITANDVVILFDAEDFESMHRNEGVWPIRDAMHSISYYRKILRKDVFGGVAGALALQGEEWYNFRSKVNPILMQPRTMQQYVDKMDEVATDFIERIRSLAATSANKDMPEDFANELNKWSLESVGVVAFDKRIGCLDPNLNPDSDAQKFIASVLEMFDLIYKLDVLPSMWRKISTPTWRRFVKVMDTITNISMKHVDGALEKMNKSEKQAHEKSVFQRLLEVDRRIAVAMGMDMLIAGIDTTAKTTGAALYFLAKNPKVQSKLREELTQLLPNRDSPVTKDVHVNAQYLKAVVKETTRLCPIGVGNLRKSAKNLVIRGYQIPKGVDIVTSNLVLSHSDDYFPKAKEFIPERWLRDTTGEISHKNTNAFVSMPFGFGPRSCVGKRLANLEIEVLLAKVIRNFYLDWHHPDMTFKTSLMYGIADPLKLNVREVTQ